MSDPLHEREGLPELVYSSIQNEKCAVSIVVPTYKRVSLLKKALDSIVCQEDFFDYELLIIDNDHNSGDEIVRLLQGYKISNLLYYRNRRNIGQIANWNTGIRLASADWVVLLHDDDRLLPNYLRTVMDTIRNQPRIDGLFTMPLTDNFGGSSNKARHNAVKKLLNVWRNYYKERQKGGLSRLSIRDYYYDCGYNAPIAPLYRKSAVLQLGGFEPEWFPVSDWEFHVRFCYEFQLFVLSRFCCILGVGDNDSLKKESRIAFIERGKIFREAMYERFRFKWGKVWIQSALWYHAASIYGLDDNELPDTVLNKKYNHWFYRIFYQSFVYFYSFFKKYYLQTEKNIKDEGKEL